MKSIVVKSPATLSNLCCGFDVLGMAVDAPFDIIKIQQRTEPGIGLVHLDSFGLSENPNENIAGISLFAFIEKLNYKQGFDVWIEKKIKPGSGLGSSAASAAGIVVAANKLMGEPLSNNELIELAMVGESFVSGSRHADNVAPCILGGTTLIRDLSSLDIVSLPNPEVYITIIHPQIEIKTAEARAILPNVVSLKNATTQWANVGGLVAGFCLNDLELVERSLMDVIVEPLRSKNIPGFDLLKEQAMEAGALGGGISGSGPSLFMFSKKESTAHRVKDAMNMVLDKLSIPYKSYVTKPSIKGIEILETI